MNLRNRKLVITLRTIYGLFMAFSGISGLMLVFSGSMEGIPPDMVPAMNVFVQTGIFYMIKITETVAGLMLVFGILPALAAIFLAPVCIGVVVFTLAVAPANVIMGVIVCAFNAYLGYVYWDKYKALFSR